MQIPCFSDSTNIIAKPDIDGCPPGLILRGSGQDRPYGGEKIYAPMRNERVLYPAVSLERWVDND